MSESMELIKAQCLKEGLIGLVQKRLRLININTTGVHNQTKVKDLRKVFEKVKKGVENMEEFLDELESLGGD